VQNDLILQLSDGCKVVLPNTLKLMTPYIIVEQGDWFEDEIKFVRLVLKPGTKAIDIGANYGVYTLSIAKCAGSSGEVWAFEPAIPTAKFLSNSIKVNQFDNIKLDRRALSGENGTTFISLNGNSEINTLVSSPSEHTQPVTTTTLDDLQTEYKWDQIDFLKIDAEGQEINIINGGKNFFSSFSPLVQYEIKEGEEIRLELVDAFLSLGYESYRLIPGLQILVPFDTNATIDRNILNLFCCNASRAEQLAKRGLLVRSGERSAEIAKYLATPQYSWQKTIANMPYGKPFSTVWQNNSQQTGNSLESALSLYFLSRDEQLPPFVRVEALRSSFEFFLNHPSNPENLLCLVRTASEYGMKALAVGALERFFQVIVNSGGDIQANTPFLAPLERFDQVDPEGRISEWTLAAALEALEIFSAYSSYFTRNQSLQRLEIIKEMGFASQEMQRRLELVKHSIALHEKPSDSAL